TQHVSLCFCSFFSTDPATPQIYTLSLHDALPIFPAAQQLAQHVVVHGGDQRREPDRVERRQPRQRGPQVLVEEALVAEHRHDLRSEEHTSELQSRENLVCRLLLEKKKNIQQQMTF